MRKLSQYLYYLNIVGMLLYIIICGGLLIAGHPWRSSQLGLIIQVASGLVLAPIPPLLTRWFHVQLPPLLVALYEIFILMAILLGTGMGMYSVPYWDKVEHAFSAAMLAGLGYMIFAALTPADQREHVSPLLLSLFAVAFGTMVGVCWEFYEFTGDGLFGMNMQRYMSGGHLLAGRAALMDTMGDLCMDFVGSLFLGIVGYFGIRRDRHWLDTYMLRRIK